MKKYTSLFLIFICGVVVGRWSSLVQNASRATSESVSRTELAPSAGPGGQSERVELAPQAVADTPSPKEVNPVNKPSDDSKSFMRTDDKVKDRQMTRLFEQLMEANRKDNSEEQNRLLAEMETLDSKHEKVFQAKVTFLQDDEDWEGAHKVLEECVATIPSSAYCLRRLANIRSSSVDERIRYGTECLQVAKNDSMCMVDLAISLQMKGDFAKSKEYFEQALSLPQGSISYNREYILYQYGFALEGLGLAQKAKAAFAESCKLKMKPACDKLKT